MGMAGFLILLRILRAVRLKAHGILRMIIFGVLVRMIVIVAGKSIQVK